MYKLLIADDESMIREGIRSLLDWESLGYEIIGDASNGDEAYALITCEQPDLVLLDIRMPGMSGLDVVRKARENGFHGKVIILSGYADFSYAQQAIRYGVLSYLTKPIDEDELQQLATGIREQLDRDTAVQNTSAHYREKAYDKIIHDILSGDADYSRLNLAELHMDTDAYQVVICETYDRQAKASGYRFSDLLRVTNQDRNSFDNIAIDAQEIFLLKGSFARKKFKEFLERFQQEMQPQKDSPLDSLFLAYGRPVTSLAGVPSSYRDASRLISRRFFCAQGQHTIGYESLPELENCAPIISEALLEDYAGRLFDALSSFNRPASAEILEELKERLYNASDTIHSIRLFFADLYLQLKERMNTLYSDAAIPFPGNGDIIRMISDKNFLYEIILYLTGQFEMIMSSIGHASRDSVLDDVIYYIEHHYMRNITLESIAPLFGYNSSYLGKIFNKKAGKNFNTYLDQLRIEHSKELLLDQDRKVYEIAEKVGYRNVDYFHIKFKKYVGQTPAEFRREHRF